MSAEELYGIARAFVLLVVVILGVLWLFEKVKGDSI